MQAQLSTSTMQAQLSTTQAQLSTTQTQLSTTQAQHNTTQVQLTQHSTTQAQLSTKHAQHHTTQTQHRTTQAQHSTTPVQNEISGNKQGLQAQVKILRNVVKQRALCNIFLHTNIDTWYKYEYILYTIYTLRINPRRMDLSEKESAFQAVLPA